MGTRLIRTPASTEPEAISRRGYTTRPARDPLSSAFVASLSPVLLHKSRTRAVFLHRNTGSPSGSSERDPVQHEPLVAFAVLADRGTRLEIQHLCAEAALNGIVNVAPEI